MMQMSADGFASIDMICVVICVLPIRVNLYNPLDLRCKRKIKNKYFCDEQKLTEKGR